MDSKVRFPKHLVWVCLGTCSSQAFCSLERVDWPTQRAHQRRARALVLGDRKPLGSWLHSTSLFRQSAQCFGPEEAVTRVVLTVWSCPIDRSTNCSFFGSCSRAKPVLNAKSVALLRLGALFDGILSNRSDPRPISTESALDLRTLAFCSLGPSLTPWQCAHGHVLLFSGALASVWFPRARLLARSPR
jgi:hypothetical protein